MSTSPSQDELAEVAAALRDNILGSLTYPRTADDGAIKTIAATIRVSDEILRDTGHLPPLPYVPTHFTRRQRFRFWRQQAKWRVKDYVTHVGRALAGRSCEHDIDDDE